jgi:hypothetical protein
MVVLHWPKLFEGGIGLTNEYGDGYGDGYGFGHSWGNYYGGGKGWGYGDIRGGSWTSRGKGNGNGHGGDE